ncbi:MAG: hypothetical protein ACOC9X_06165 [bacterium]
MATTKTCPYCYSTIDARAIVCPQCRRDLTTKPPPTKADKVQTQSSTSRFLWGAFIIVVAFIYIASLVTGDGDEPSRSDGATNEGGALVRLTATPSTTPEAERGSPKPSTPAPTPTPPLAPPFATFRQNYDTMTDAQWEAFEETVRGARVEGWEGVIDDVDTGEIMGGYTIEVRMEEGTSFSPVSIDVPEDVALSLNREQRIRFSGRIRYASNDFLLSIAIEDAQVTVVD